MEFEVVRGDKELAKMSDSEDVKPGTTFAMQIGLVRESVTLKGESGDLVMSTLKDIACAFVDRKVGTT